MSVEERILYLMRAALRAEREGAAKVARSLRRMADGLRPAQAEGMDLALATFSD